MSEQILVPLDGSQLAEAALPHAMAVARATSASLVLLRAIPAPATTQGDAWVGLYSGDLWEGWEDEQATAYDYLARVAAHIEGDGLEVQTVLKEGDPAHAIIAHAEAHPRVAVIVMSTHGRSGPARWLLGSVAEKVLHASPVPVLMVRAPKALTAAGDTTAPAYETILVPLDGSPFAEQALDRAKVVAAASGAHLVLVSVAPDYPEHVVIRTAPRPPVRWLEWANEAERLVAYLEEKAGELRAGGLKVQTRILYGPPADGILQVGRDVGADLIVMATHGRSGLQRLWLGSVALKVVRSAQQPVLLVRAKERAQDRVLQPALAARGLVLQTSG